MKLTKAIKKTKAQVRMTETIAILFVFFILLIFGFIFYSKVEVRNIQLQGSQIQDQKAVEVAEIFSFLPEIQCTKQNIPTHNCIDIMKIDAFSSLIKNNQEYKQYYYDQFLRSRITVNESYPDSSVSFVVYNQVPDKWTKKSSTQIPVAIYNATGDPTTGRLPYYAFGIVYIDYYS